MRSDRSAGWAAAPRPSSKPTGSRTSPIRRTPLGPNISPGLKTWEHLKSTGDWELEVVKRPFGVRGWSQQPKRWIVERTFAWLLRSRRLVADYERKVQTSETLIELAMIRLLVARLGRDRRRVLTFSPGS